MDLDEKLSLVSNNNGSTLATVVLFGILPTVTILQWKVLMWFFAGLLTDEPKQVLLEHTFLVVPICFILTLGADVLDFILLTILMVVILSISFLYSIPPKSLAKDITLRHPNMFLFEWTFPRPLPFITAYRGSLLVLTAFCILAVDFPVFPRYLSKTETFGWSLMDVGVGAFVYAQGLLCYEARSNDWWIPLGRRVKYFRDSVVSVLPIAVLGVGRLVSLKVVGYHEHVSEYGVHWNFFFTLVFCRVGISLLFALCPNAYVTALFAIPGFAFYQYQLNQPDMLEYMLGDTRDGLLNANKEGIYSLFGYVMIYAAGMVHGRQWQLTVDKTWYSWLKVSLYELIAVGTTFCLVIVSDSFQPPSRRLCNLTYVVWVVFFNRLMLLLHLLIDLLLSFLNWLTLVRDADSMTLLLDAWNSHGLFMFLLANLLTGLTNLSIETHNTDDEPAFIFLFLYMTLLSVVAFCAHKIIAYRKIVASSAK